MSTDRLGTGAVRPLRTLEAGGSAEDLAWLDEAIGDARVVAIGENAHYSRESYQLRLRLTRYLVERHGFGAYAMESGFTEGWATDAWVRGSNSGSGLGEEDPAEDPAEVMANGITSLMGLWTEMRTHLVWLRQHNRTAARPVGFYGADLSGSNISLLPGLDAALGYLAEADPEFTADPGIRETAAAFAVTSALSFPQAIGAYGQLPQERRDALTAGLAELAARMSGRELEYRARTGEEAYQRALRSLQLTVTIDANSRALATGDRSALFFNRDAAMADTVEWILGREERIVLAAHNGHVQRWPALFPGMPPASTLGQHLADRLGDDYLVIGVTNGTGQTLNIGADFYAGKFFAELEPPRAGTLDALMAASADPADGPFAVDLRRLAPADTEAVDAVHEQRLGAFYAEVDARAAYDVVVHLPHVSAAAPDAAALAASPDDVRKAFAQWGEQQ